MCRNADPSIMWIYNCEMFCQVPWTRKSHYSFITKKLVRYNILSNEPIFPYTSNHTISKEANFPIQYFGSYADIRQSIYCMLPLVDRCLQFWVKVIKLHDRDCSFNENG